ncbi:MAG: nucleoside 2-deoxyribosyltransferase domain-containing protein [Bacteroidota bacterium]
MKKVFLGGTCSGSHWRQVLIPRLKIAYFDPVVPTWTEADYQKELAERAECDYLLYVLSPKAEGYYSVAEVVDDSNKRPERTILVLLVEDGDQQWSPHQWRSLQKVGEMVQRNGGHWLENLEAAAQFLNQL